MIGRANLVYVLVLLRSHKIMLERGLRSEALLKNTGLDDADLLDPYHVITGDQAIRYYRNLVHLAPPGFGLDVGSRSRLSDFGSTGYSIKATATMKEAIDQSHHRYGLFYQHVDWESTVCREAITHRLSVPADLRDLRLFISERGLAILKVHAHELIGPDCYPDEVTLAYPDPGYAQRYREIFNCPVSFNCPHTEIRYPGKYPRFESSSYDPEVREVLDNLSEMLSRKLQSETDIVASVRLAILKRPGFFPGIEAVAEKLDMSSRTLSRKLREAGGNYQRLLDDARRTIAEDRLVHSRMSIQQIAEACGFRDAQNFSQAFKRWKGMLPSEFRRAHS